MKVDINVGVVVGWFCFAAVAAVAAGQGEQGEPIDPFSPSDPVEAERRAERALLKKEMTPDGDITVRAEWYVLPTKTAWNLLREFPGGDGGGEVLYRRVRELVKNGNVEFYDAAVVRRRPDSKDKKTELFSRPGWDFVSGGTLLYGGEVQPPAGTPQGLGPVTFPSPYSVAKESKERRSRALRTPLINGDERVGTRLGLRSAVIKEMGTAIRLTFNTELVRLVRWELRSKPAVMHSGERVPVFHAMRFMAGTTIRTGEMAFLGALTPAGDVGRNDPDRKVFMFVRADIEGMDANEIPAERSSRVAEPTVMVEWLDLKGKTLSKLLDRRREEPAGWDLKEEIDALVAGGEATIREIMAARGIERFAATSYPKRELPSGFVGGWARSEKWEGEPKSYAEFLRRQDEQPVGIEYRGGWWGTRFEGVAGGFGLVSGGRVWVDMKAGVGGFEGLEWFGGTPEEGGVYQPRFWEMSMDSDIHLDAGVPQLVGVLSPTVWVNGIPKADPETRTVVFLRVVLDRPGSENALLERIEKERKSE